jgi:hypothetical protein
MTEVSIPAPDVAERDFRVGRVFNPKFTRNHVDPDMGRSGLVKHPPATLACIDLRSIRLPQSSKPQNSLNRIDWCEQAALWKTRTHPRA